MQAFDFPLRTESTTPHTPPPSSHSSRNRASFRRRTTTKRPAASNPSSPRAPANFPAQSGRALPAGDFPGVFRAPDDAGAKKPREKRSRRELGMSIETWNQTWKRIDDGMRDVEERYGSVKYQDLKNSPDFWSQTESQNRLLKTTPQL